MAVTKEEVVEFISNMTVLELSEFIKELEEKFGVSAAAPAAAMMVAAPAAAGAPAAANNDIPAGTQVTSPMVGTVYMSSSPGAAPFVKVGDTVKEGDTLLIVEAMKVMNPIKAPKGGTINRIMVNDAQPVEFGEILVIIG